MNSQDNHKNEPQIPTRFRILIYALEKGITQTAFMQAYNEILFNVEETENDLSPEVRQSMIERQVWTKFFPNENSPPPLKFSVAEGFFDPPVSREAVEQYRIWQTSYLYSHQGQESNSEQRYDQMQRGRNCRPIPDSMDDSTITPRVDNGRAGMPNQSIKPSRSTSSMNVRFNQQLNNQQPETSKPEAVLFNGDMVPVEGVLFNKFERTHSGIEQRP